MNWKQWVLIINVILGVMVIVHRAATKTARVYTPGDAVIAVVEGALITWLVVTI